MYQDLCHKCHTVLKSWCHKKEPFVTCDKRLWNLWHKSRVSLGLKNLTPNMKNILQHPPRSAMSDENEEDHRDTIHMNAAAPWQRSRCILSWALWESSRESLSLVLRWWQELAPSPFSSSSSVVSIRSVSYQSHLHAEPCLWCSLSKLKPKHKLLLCLTFENVLSG